MKTVSRGITQQIFRLLSSQGQKQLRAVFSFAAISGVVRGLALSVFLPAATALVKQENVWGLSIVGWLCVLLFLGITSAILEYVLAMANYSVALDSMVSLHKQIGDQVARLPLGYFTSETAGKFSRLVSKQMLMLGESFAHFLAPMIMNTFTMLVLLVGCWIWSPSMGILLTISVPVMLVAVWIAQRCKERDDKLNTPPSQELSARLVEFAQNQPILRACGQAGSFEPLMCATKASEKAGIRGLWWGLFGNIIVGTASQFVAVFSMIIAVSTTFGFSDPIATIVFIGIMLRFTTMLSEIGSLGMALEGSRPLLLQINELLDEPVLTDPISPKSIEQPGSVELQEVYFGYTPDASVLNGVSIRFAPHSYTAIVGPSGCGKTTLARLIARFYEVDRGAVLVGGVPVKEQRVADLMKQIAWVFQDVYLYDDTLEANIRVGNPDATEQQIRHAADLAGVTEIVNRLPDGWDTKVGEGGRALSGGERQRVSIARAIIKDAPIVLFDEATSALDPANEKHVVESLNYLRKRATLVVIAHKLSTIQTADQIVVLDSHGRIAQHGTHQELLDKDGTYREFWELRQAAKGWSLT
ncbi:ABC transporter ATP-binding protein [Arcanobacterium buesumense]|uniref:ABC transporter ATP-binding protein n=1 Tax=Arcanobacterium buesumense TaxID=2722751 RepID=A0A6H2EM37_9ACTO|nr:ABC transporter ATP-binding protein [Arcanobacterium buesumense]QJC22131.1 ABC transporter ATP-binding protein [Arcanobacterium buesumense]